MEWAARPPVVRPERRREPHDRRGARGGRGVLERPEARPLHRFADAQRPTRDGAPLQQPRRALAPHDDARDDLPRLGAAELRHRDVGRGDVARRQHHVLHQRGVRDDHHLHPARGARGDGARRGRVLLRPVERDGLAQLLPLLHHLLVHLPDGQRHVHHEPALPLCGLLRRLSDDGYHHQRQALPLLLHLHPAAQDRQVHRHARPQDEPRHVRPARRRARPALLRVRLHHVAHRLRHDVLRAAGPRHGPLQHQARLPHIPLARALRRLRHRRHPQQLEGLPQRPLLPRLPLRRRLHPALHVPHHPWRAPGRRARRPDAQKGVGRGAARVRRARRLLLHVWQREARGAQRCGLRREGGGGARQRDQRCRRRRSHSQRALRRLRRRLRRRPRRPPRLAPRH
mmetsp:Transcript_407/g.1019  ORF Transcript_407/g.1019 Transcript_407/m.1019 type:complete len:399 (-) Transcript_407:240-1436(-)